MIARAACGDVGIPRIARKRHLRLGEADRDAAMRAVFNRAEKSIDWMANHSAAHPGAFLTLEDLAACLA